MVPPPGSIVVTMVAGEGGDKSLGRKGVVGERALSWYTIAHCDCNWPSRTSPFIEESHKLAADIICRHL